MLQAALTRSAISLSRRSPACPINNTTRSAPTCRTVSARAFIPCSLCAKSMRIRITPSSTLCSNQLPRPGLSLSSPRKTERPMGNPIRKLRLCQVGQVPHRRLTNGLPRPPSTPRARPTSFATPISENVEPMTTVGSHSGTVVLHRYRGNPCSSVTCDYDNPMADVARANSSGRTYTT